MSRSSENARGIGGVDANVRRAVEGKDRHIGRKIERGPETEGNAQPTLTAYMIRHGETSDNKFDPNRGLTEEGKQQMDAAADRLIAELDPNRDIINLLQSGNPRATMSVERIAAKLKAAGFKFMEPIKLIPASKRKGASTYFGATTEPERVTYYRRGRAANFTDDAKKLLASPEIHKRLNITDKIAKNKDAKRIPAWYGLAELGELPEGAESPEHSAGRMEEAYASIQKQLPLVADHLEPGKRLVSIMAANASTLDAAITARTGKDAFERPGEVENAEGFRIDFAVDQEPEFDVWGPDIESKIHGNAA